MQTVISLPIWMLIATAIVSGIIGGAVAAFFFRLWLHGKTVFSNLWSL